MDDFKNSTKTQYMKGGACEGYAKGGKVKGAAKINKVMGEFKRGELHSGSSKGPEVSNRKQAVAIALSEARKAGANAPVKKNRGGLMSEGVSSRPTNASGRRITLEELERSNRDVGGMSAAQEAAAGRAVARGNRMQALEAREEQRLMREAKDTRRVSPRTREVSTERRATMQRDIREPLIAPAPIRRKAGGLAVMPHGKKC